MSDSDQPTSPPAASPSPDLVHTVRRGTRVVLLAQAASQVISLVVLGWMMRLVLPGEYGLLGMALPAVLLPRMAATLGFSATVMQRDLAQHELSSLFWLNITWGMLAAAATAVLGLWLGRAYDQPLVGPVCLALAGSTLLVAFSNQHQALLERKFQLAPLAAVRLLAQVCGGFAGIYSARRGAGVWALVAQQYGELVVLALWVWMLEPWRPDWPRRGQGVGGLLRFSGYYSASQLVYYVCQNLDKLLLPVLLGRAAEAAVGLYSQAASLAMKPVAVLTAPLTGVMVAGLSQARPDPAMHTALVTRFFRLIGVGLFPCAAGLTIVAHDAMIVLGGQRWQAAGSILAALAPALFVQGLVNIAMHVFASAGRSGRLLVATILLLVLLVLGALAGIQFGRTHLAAAAGDSATGAAIGMAAGYTAVLVGVWFVPYVWLCLRTVDVQLVDVLWPLWPALRSALLMGLVVFVLARLGSAQNMRPAVRLALSVSAGVAAYGWLAWREIAWCWQEMIAVGSPPSAPSP